MTDRFSFTYYGTVPSTNDILKEMARAHAPEGSVVIADAQTAGRGRMGRRFFSPAGSGLYMSVLLRPKLPADLLVITVNAAVAAAKAIEKHTGRPARIKWINDIFQEGKKVCGILAEGQTGGKDPAENFVVLGIGVNLFAPRNGFPEPLRDTAGALFPAPCPFDKNAFARDILAGVFDGCGDLYAEYAGRDMLRGRPVRVRVASQEYAATAAGIARDFSLRLQCGDGREILLRAGEVSVIPNGKGEGE